MNDIQPMATFDREMKDLDILDLKGKFAEHGWNISAISQKPCRFAMVLPI